MKQNLEDFQQFITRCKDKRERIGMSLSEISEMTGLDKGHISLLERGKINPTVPTLIRYLYCLGIQIDWESLDEKH
jgi:transcriptional regulator with XRE-family HTH domain